MLDPYRDIATYYDCEHDRYREDIAFFLRHIGAGPVLEVGAGTGRIMESIARSGIEVWGVDPSAGMLERAREKLSSLAEAHLVHGTVADLPAGLTMRTAILPLNVLWHFLNTDAQLRLLVGVRARLMPGGKLIIDVSNPLTLADRGGRGEVRERFSGPCGDGYLRVSSSTWDDEAEQLLTLSLVYDVTDQRGSVRRTQTVLELRYLYRFELELLLCQAGFGPRELYGSYDLDPYDALSPKLLVIADRE